jgi:putative transcriptional regulator
VIGRASHPSGHHSGLVGQLLVSPPALGDPNFRHRVVLVLAHQPEGAFGLVLNEPTSVGIETLLDDIPAWIGRCCAPAVVFKGGPVDPSTVVALGRPTPGVPAPWAWLLDAVGTVDLESDPADVDGLHDVRIFAGYAGWGPGQLDGELAVGGWYVVPAEPGDAFTEQPDRLWASVLRRAGGEVALVSTHPTGDIWN